MKRCWLTKSDEKTVELGKKFGKYLRDKNIVVALRGDLGSGKTTFVKGVAEALGIQEEIKSPTFVILKKYDSEFGILVHVDAYRLQGGWDDIGLMDYFGQAKVLIEWADNIKNILPKSSIQVVFTNINERQRKICFDKKISWK